MYIHACMLHHQKTFRLPTRPEPTSIVVVWEDFRIHSIMHEINFLQEGTFHYCLNFSAEGKSATMLKQAVPIFTF